ncbi:MAG: DUF4276 family protein [Myxococcota bacterium]|jgi:hypothetical protein|nr:DUF4276 family protein [Myxococcota bacterium]
MNQPSKLIFLVEEPSMQDFLYGFLPRVLPHDLPFQVVSHQGKSDLQRSIPRKLRAWREPGVRFIVLMDQDSADCADIKARLLTLCREGRRDDTIVRIVCRELEAWFIGDLPALDKALGTRLQYSTRRAFKRDPDAIGSPSAELEQALPAFQKRATARAIAPLITIDPECNRSHSYGVFLRTLAAFS